LYLTIKCNRNGVKLAIGNIYSNFIGKFNSNATITYTGTDPSTSTYSWDFNGGTPSTGTGQGPFSVQWATPAQKQ
jgi:hypothetical protein